MHAQAVNPQHLYGEFGFMRSLFMRALLCLSFGSLFFSSVSSAALTQTPIFGPESYQRGSGQPVMVTSDFTSAYPGESCLLQVYNGGLEDSEFELVSSSTIALNGIQVVAPNEFNQQTSYIEKIVTVNASNELAVEVRGKPGGGIVVQVACERDVEPPTIEATLSTPPNTAGWHTQNVTVSFTCSDADSAIASCTAPITVSTEAAGQVISGEAVDAFGNSATASVTLNLDKTAPQIAATPAPLANLFGWHNGDVTVAFSCSDALSGIVQCPADLLVNSEGAAQTVNGTVVDVAGNSASVTHTLNVDKSAPLITPTLSAPADLNGWHHSDVTVSFDCSDVLSGIATCTSPQLISSEGANQLIGGSAEDKSGHSAHADVTINLDKFAPTISATPTPLPNSNGWHNADVNITFDCSDSGAGIATCTGPVLLTTEGAGLTITGTATDLAGKSTSLTTTVNLDKTAPQITASVTPVANAAGWHNRAVSIAYSCTDALSGIDTCPTSTSIITDGAGQGVSGTATDLAGNSATTSVTLNIDQTAPVVEINSPLEGDVLTDSAVAVSGAVADANALSGITINGDFVIPAADGSFTHTLALGEGSHAITVSAVDVADNSGSATVNVSININSGSVVLPPDPATVAPPLDTTVVTDIHVATEFLYTGENPIQTGVVAGTIAAYRVAVLSGEVSSSTNEPLSGVTITIHGHPELGQTLTRSDGGFDMVSNGGGVITVDYQKAGYLPIQRKIDTAWNIYYVLPNVVMLPLDNNVTTIDLTTSTSVQIARGSVVSDERGIRQVTFVFPVGLEAELVHQNGVTEPLSQMNVRATEYTVGINGPNAMPGELPATSGYTYAAEFSVDEALSSGAKGITFNQPVPIYVDNFLNFPIGAIAPPWLLRSR